MSGRYIMARGWQEHPLFENDEYSRRDAWEWLIANSCYEDTQCNIKGRIIALKRGQLSHSVRFLAKKWKWKITTVWRFLKRLKTETMIETGNGTGQLIITICNYNQYQCLPKNGGTPAGTGNGTQVEQERNKDKEIKETPYGADQKPANGNPVKNLFDIGVEYFVSKGVSEQQARTFIGKLRKDYDDGEIIGALIQAQKEQVIDPKAWIAAYFRNRSRAAACADMMN